MKVFYKKSDSPVSSLQDSFLNYSKGIHVFICLIYSIVYSVKKGEDYFLNL